MTRPTRDEIAEALWVSTTVDTFPWDPDHALADYWRRCADAVLALPWGPDGNDPRGLPCDQLNCVCEELPQPDEVCPMCKGAKVLWPMSQWADDCPRCDGTGRVPAAGRGEPLPEPDEHAELRAVMQGEPAAVAREIERRAAAVPSVRHPSPLAEFDAIVRELHLLDVSGDAGRMIEGVPERLRSLRPKLTAVWQPSPAEAETLRGAAHMLSLPDPANNHRSMAKALNAIADRGRRAEPQGERGVS